MQPRSARSEVSGEIGGALKLKLAAPPVDGKANEECKRFLATLLGVPKSAVEIVAGETSRVKVIRIRGVNGEQLRGILER